MSLRMTIAMIVLTVSIGCGSSTSPAPSPAPMPLPSGSSTSASIVSGASTLTTTAYSPNPLNISVGTTVIWRNNDNMAHTSTANGGAWDSGVIQPSGQFSFALQSRGTFPYHCTIHPNMVGTVNVQ